MFSREAQSRNLYDIKPQDISIMILYANIDKNGAPNNITRL